MIHSKKKSLKKQKLHCKQVQISKDYPWRNSLSYHWRGIMKGAGFRLAGTDVGGTPGSSHLLSVLECKLRLFIYVHLHIYWNILVH